MQWLIDCILEVSMRIKTFDLLQGLNQVFRIFNLMQVKFLSMMIIASKFNYIIHTKFLLKLMHYKCHKHSL